MVFIRMMGKVPGLCLPDAKYVQRVSPLEEVDNGYVLCLLDGAATARYMVCIARHVGPAEKTLPAFSLQQFTTKQDLNGRILAYDTRSV